MRRWRPLPDHERAYGDTRGARSAELSGIARILALMRRSAMPHLASLLGAFLAVAVGMGLISAGLLMPLAGASGSVTKATVQGFNDIDDEFTPSVLAEQSKILSADNKVLATPYDANRVVVPLNKVAPIMRKAQLAIEDSRFYEHGGMDIRGTMRAFVNNLGSDSTQGGSSITQQYVKIMEQEKALRNDDKEAAAAAIAPTYSRKVQQMKYALSIEKTMTKDQILSGYLNLVYYGDQAYGIEAAAQHYFSKPAAKLNLAESATLAGVVQSPGVLNPRTNPEGVQERRDLVIDRMLQLGMVTEKSAKKAKSTSVKKSLKLKKNEGGTCTKSVDPYFCNYVMAYLRTMPELGPDPDARQLAVTTGGLRIKTTLRRDWQLKMERDLRSTVPPTNSHNIGAAAALVEPGTGKVRAIAQSSDYKIGLKRSTARYTEQAWSVPSEYGGTRGFAIGSTAKMYNLVAALEMGMPITASVNADQAGPSSPHTYQYNYFQDHCSGANWEVRNDFNDGGTITLAEMTAQSINTAFAELAHVVGSCKLPKVMDRMGLQDGNGNQYGLVNDPNTGEKIKGEYAISSIVLGADASTPLQLANSYATLAADGKYCPPNPIEKITTARGKEIKIAQPECKQVLKPGVARGVTQLLEGPIKNGTARGAQLNGGRVAAGKTGTTDGHRQSWFVGYTPQLASAVWVGTPITEKRMDGVVLNGRAYGSVFGGTIAAPLWKRIVDDASSGMPMKQFTSPSQDIQSGEQVSIPSVIGMTQPQAEQALQRAGFSVNATLINTTAAAGTVVGTSPSGSTGRGSVVTIQVSTGRAPLPPPAPKKEEPKKEKPKKDNKKPKPSKTND